MTRVADFVVALDVAAFAVMAVFLLAIGIAAAGHEWAPLPADLATPALAWAGLITIDRLVKWRRRLNRAAEVSE